MTNQTYYDLIVVIVNLGKASRVLAEAKKNWHHWWNDFTGAWYSE